MTIRDIKILSKIIQNKIELGMQLDSFICKEFEKRTKHMNFIFSNGIDFIYEFFNFDKKKENKNLSKILRAIGKNKKFTNTLIDFADQGLIMSFRISKFLLSNKTCFSSREKGEAIAKAFIVSFKSCFSRDFQFIM